MFSDQCRIFSFFSSVELPFPPLGNHHPDWGYRNGVEQHGNGEFQVHHQIQIPILTLIMPQGLEWTLLFLAYVLVGARIFVRLGMRRDSLYWSDYWLVVALASAQALLICDTLTYRDHAMDDFDVKSVSLDKVCQDLGFSVTSPPARMPKRQTATMGQAWA